jgi:hypothetical protein
MVQMFRMVQEGRGFGFALATDERLRIASQFLGKELQGDVTAQLEVFSLVHHPHSAPPILLKMQ